MENSKKHVLIVAGEASGDLHAAHLVDAIRECDPNITFSGVGGKKMSASGVELYENITNLAVVGFWEVLTHFKDIKRIFYLLLDKVREQKPDAVILVDYPGFNLRLAKELRKLNIKVIYYISPQVWAWKESRVKLIKQVVDRMIVLFAFEKDFYARHGMDVFFAGHPLLETISSTEESPYLLKSLGLSPGKTTVGILPGSRAKEIETMLPVMVDAAQMLYLGDKNLQFIVMRAPTVAKETLETHLQKSNVPMAIVDNQTYAGIRASQICMVTSGTATLETAILQKPMVVVYKTSFFSWLLAKLFVKIPCIGLVNVVAGKKVVPECVQFDATPEKISREIRLILSDATRMSSIKSELERVKNTLGESGAGTRAAEEIIRVLKT